MTTYARIISGTVQEVIDFAPAGRFTGEIAAMFTEVPDGTGANDILNGDGTWTKYVPPVVVPYVPPPPPRAPVSKREFLKLFTPTEYGAIKAATAANATVDYYWQQFVLAEFISLDAPDTLGGLQLLESIGLLAAGRADEIVA